MFVTVENCRILGTSQNFQTFYIFKNDQTLLVGSLKTDISEFLLVCIFLFPSFIRAYFIINLWFK
jgi:hypothetical protein